MGAIALICKQTGVSGGANHKGRDMSCMYLGHRVSAALPVGPGFGVETKELDCVSFRARQDSLFEEGSIGSGNCRVTETPTVRTALVASSAWWHFGCLPQSIGISGATYPFYAYATNSFVA